MQEINTAIRENGIESTLQSLFFCVPFTMTGDHSCELYLLIWE